MQMSAVQQVKENALAHTQFCQRGATSRSQNLDWEKSEKRMICAQRTLKVIKKKKK